MQFKKLIWKKVNFVAIQAQQSLQAASKRINGCYQRAAWPTNTLLRGVLSSWKWPICPPSPTTPFANLGSGAAVGVSEISALSSADSAASLISGLEPSASSSRGLWSSPVLCSSPGGLQLSPDTVKWFLNTRLSTCSVTVSMAAVPGFCSEWY